MNNFERIKKMTIEEMAEFLTDFDCFKLCEHEGACKTSTDCFNGLKKYLETDFKYERSKNATTKFI